ncbi:hypothetical protein [Tenacibaculum amylolyticum]|uniref:hypothetical protein n=1 Tax=Tenacibaculum amylolyticum TaxID=104269 RepID=UPI003893FF82
MKNLNGIKSIMLGGLMFSVLFSCQKEELEIDMSDPILHSQNYSKSSSSEMTKLGKKLENPYSVENMKNAWESLKNKVKITKNIEIKTTHYYVKFKPKTEEELNILRKDESLILYDIPLDYEIIEQGDFYHDPEIPTDQPTYQYASIPVENKLPEKIHFEILEKLFIPDEDSETNPSNSDGTVELLVDESLKLTDNLGDEKNEKAKFFTKLPKWRPQGNIIIWDDNLQRYVPLAGLKVRARRWFITYSGYTNGNGFFSCNGRFRRPANYSFKWQKYDFEIRRQPLSIAKFNGPYIRGDWNVNIRNGEQEFWGTIYRAAFHYYYGNIKGLRRPPLNGVFNIKMKIRAIYQNNNSINGLHCVSCKYLGLGSQVKIFNPQKDSQDIYATTIHELAHASHWAMDSFGYTVLPTVMIESWASGIQWELTRMVYPNYTPHYIKGSYTGIVQDMIDPIQQPYDKVAGYTIRQLEDAINGQTTWRGWRDAIINSYNNPYELNLHNYQFLYWKFY